MRHDLQGTKARLAQSAERKALNLVVVGSSPTVGVFASRPLGGVAKAFSPHAHLVAPFSHRLQSPIWA